MTEEASRIIDDAVRAGEIKILAWSELETEEALAQACLGFDYGGHDMQPRTDDRSLLHLAAWLDSIEHFEDDSGLTDSTEHVNAAEVSTSSAARCQVGNLTTAPLDDAAASQPATPADASDRGSRTLTGESARACVFSSDPPGTDKRTLETITRRTVLKHPLLAPRLDELYQKAREVNATLPKELNDFVDQTLDGYGEVSFISRGQVKWQAALFHGPLKSRAEAWKSAKKKDKDRVKEMAGDWITAEPP